MYKVQTKPIPSIVFTPNASNLECLPSFTTFPYNTFNLPSTQVIIMFMQIIYYREWRVIIVNWSGAVMHVCLVLQCWLRCNLFHDNGTGSAPTAIDRSNESEMLIKTVPIGKFLLSPHPVCKHRSTGHLHMGNCSTSPGPWSRLDEERKPAEPQVLLLKPPPIDWIQGRRNV